MSKNSQKEVQPLVLANDKNLEIVYEEKSSINESMQIINDITKKHNISMDELVELVRNRKKYVSIPVGLFRSKLAPLESVVRYLKDVLGYNFVEIARMISRDETTIWTSYNNSISKADLIVDLVLEDVTIKNVRKEELVVPISVFRERKISCLEGVSLFLKERFGLSYHEIGLILGRNERTIWTAVNRARKKLG